MLSAEDFLLLGVCEPLLQANLQLPVLGVCMGMQALAVAHGAKVHHAPEPIHGRLSQIQHTSHRLFQGIPSGGHRSVKMSNIPLTCC